MLLERVGRCLILASWALAALGPTTVRAAAGPDQRLLAAAQEGDLPAVRTLIAAGVDVNAPRSDGSTPLMWAVHRDDLPMVDLLLKAGAKADLSDEQGVTPLTLAAENGSLAVASRLLQAGADPRKAQANGVTPLMVAARSGSVPVVKALTTAGADASTVIPATGQTALMWAVAERHLPVVRELLAAGADVRTASSLGFTALLFAVRNGDTDTATALLEAGADVNQPGSDGTHALPLALVSGRGAMARLLVERGADVNGTLHGVTALHAAAGKVDTWIRDWLRARHASVDARSTAGLPPAERVELVKLLLTRGAHINARAVNSTFVGLGISGWYGARDPISTHVGDLKGATPLWVAAYWANGNSPDAAAAVDVIRELLAAGADPNVTTADGSTPLMAAAGLGHGSYQPGAERGARSVSAEAAVALLVGAGADVNAPNEGRFTALHGAAFRGLNEVIEYLVKHGAQIDAQDFRGRTAYRIAQGAQQGFRVQQWPKTAAFIAELGADITLGVDGLTEERERARAGATGAKP
ncbi:MAG: ankyrin repeat domain-containing protein [Vicinamibacterales bacterium]